MYDFHNFSPLPGEKFPAARQLSMGVRIPEQMQDRFGRIFSYVGSMTGLPLASGQIRVFPGHVYQQQDEDVRMYAWYAD